MSEAVQNIIENGCRQMQLTVSPAVIAKLVQYVALLAKWNKAYNLTAVRDVQEMASRHILDSLSVAPYLVGERFIDVGTGPGLPGIPLALLSPDKTFHLLDSNSKKTRFLAQARLELGLQNVTVFHERVENHRPELCYDAVLSRAFASLADMVNGCHHLIGQTGCFLAMKGLNPVDEIKDLPPGYEVVDTYVLQVPGSDGERHLLRLANHNTRQVFL